jgi:hypothetical protein
MTAEDLARYYDESLPAVLYLAPSTGATAGSPGSFTPANTKAPASVEALIAGSPNVVVASPLTAWTTGQYVQTRTAGVAGRANWSGTAWVAGAHALMAEAQSSDEPDASPVDDPGSFTVAQIEEWVAENPELAGDVLDAEQAGKARTTLVAWLEAFVADDDEVDEP